MRKRGFACLAGVALAPAALWAEPCVTTSFERALPGATDIQVRVADVPSARFPALWQEGLLFGYTYKMYSNGDAVLASDFERPDWKIELSCDGGASECSYTQIGEVPPSAPDIARILGKCLLGDDAVGEEVVAEQVAPEPVPESIPEPEPEPEVVVAVNTGDCAATKVPDGGTVITLQRLLVVAGADPGPVDGLIGPTTLNALSSVLNDPEVSSDLEDASERLRKKLCAPQD